MIINQVKEETNTKKDKIKIPQIRTLKQMSDEEASLHRLKLDIMRGFAIKHTSVLEMLWKRSLEVVTDIIAKRKEDRYTGILRREEGEALLQEGVLSYIEHTRPDTLYAWFDKILENGDVDTRKHDKAENTYIDCAYYKSGRRHIAITPIVIKNLILVELATRIKTAHQ